MCGVEQRTGLALLTLRPQRRHGCLLTEKSHARRDQIPSPAPACGAGRSNRWLVRVLAGRLGPPPNLLCRDGIKTEKLKPECSPQIFNKRNAPVRTRAGEKRGWLLAMPKICY